ncbi:hypothetical protein [Sulfurospirillum sp. 1612]|uniref:hypothetical protein n=1 Tax=Sulfurospirillum sp. 1612 TaxID=3094835 RepID=UPI002F939714
MIRQIKRVAKISQQSSYSKITFNTNLPLSITVLEKLYQNQYKLQVGKQELKARSNRTLSVNKQYWGILEENKEAILNLSHLVQKPEIYNSNSAFLDIEFDLFAQLLEEDPTPIQTLKKQMVEKMLDATTSKEEFLTLTYMLLAQNQGIFHFPIFLEGKKILLQFEKQDLHTTVFYLAFENLGPIRGIIRENGKILDISFEVMFDKSYQLLQKELKQNDLHITVTRTDMMVPLFNPSDVLLDVKG